MSGLVERTLELWSARRDASRDPCPCDGHPHDKCFCDGACSCHWEQNWEQTAASDPKKLVPPCNCPQNVDSDMTEARARQETIGAVMSVVNHVEPESWTPPSSAEDAVQSPPEAAGDPPSPDAAAAFVEASVAVDRRAFTSTAEIMAAARVWCAENDLPVFHPRALAEQLKRRRGVQAHSNGQRRGWRGVKLR